LCESKAILLYAASIFLIRQRKGNIEASEERMTAPFALDSKGVFVDLHSHGGYVGWLWGFGNRRTPNNASLGALGRKFASFSGYGLWAQKCPIDYVSRNTCVAIARTTYIGMTNVSFARHAFC
jgi:hypothetical protein